ncbi:MAG: cyclic nucleotide-binding protein [Terriglobia bacterium]|nr:MAG: cyclic nucleotide-binding protein [Terriglobia bacterium]
MPKRAPEGFEPRFIGQAGRRRLAEVLRSQTLVSGDVALARELLKHGTPRDYEPQQCLTVQGAPDNDIFFIVSGTVSIRINGREIATRTGGTHVGEMAVVDAAAKRSASVVALEPTFTLTLTEDRFARLANRYPQLWRRVASEIANRLRERNKHIRPPNNKPVLFIGSSTEGIPIAEQIRNCIRSRQLVTRIWTDGVFEASRTSIESLFASAQVADFAALLLTPDDITFSKRMKKASPRDNLVFELGLFMGVIGRERVFILKPRGAEIKIPSDLFGVTWIEYPPRGPRSLRARIAPICRQISRIINTKGPR